MLSGQLVSSGGTLDRPEKAVTITVPSGCGGGSVFLEFAATATAAATTYGRLMRFDGSGAFFTVYSGAGPGYGIVTTVPTPFVRIAVTSGPTAGPAVFTLHPAGR